MNILFLLSSLEPAGSETYCIALARAWGSRHQIFWISDRLHFGQDYTALPISRKAIPGGLVNTWKVTQFIRRHQIALIHSHSRRAHWVAAQAASLTGIPHVTTVHQPLPVHFFSRLFPCLGDHAIAIDEVVRDHIQRYFGRTPSNTSLIRNGIDLEPYRSSPLASPATHAPKQILILGRLTGGRWKVIQFLLTSLQRFGASLPVTHYQIVGRIPAEREDLLRKQISDTNRVLSPSIIELMGFQPNLKPLLETCDGVIAGGRSAMESMAAGKPVIILGEGGLVGLSRPETFTEALRTNFGDHLSGDAFIPAQLEVALRELLSPTPPFPEMAIWCRQQMETHYNIASIAQQVEDIYKTITL